MSATITIPVLQGGAAVEEIPLPSGIVVSEKDQLGEHECMFRIMHQEKGDERLTWDRRDFAQIKAAKKLFLDLIKKGLKPFRVGVGGAQSSEAMAEFDPLAEEVIFMPHALVAGG